MSGFVKLWASILDSTIWFKFPDRDIFFAALLKAMPKEFLEPQPQLFPDRLEPTGFVVPPGWYGFCEVSGPALIHLCALPISQEEGMAALLRMSEPESESRSQKFEGRRIARVDHGYVVLNFMEYRDRDAGNAARCLRYREKKKIEASKSKNRRRRVTNEEILAEAAEDLQRRDEDEQEQDPRFPKV